MRSAPLPLAAAAVRLRGKPGRPRKAHPADPIAAIAVAAAGLPPRLLDVEAAARYLSISSWTVRDLYASGRLPRVRFPLGGDRELRRLLFDVRDLDKLIEAARETA
jgi:hypothetical protein